MIINVGTLENLFPITEGSTVFELVEESKYKTVQCNCVNGFVIATINGTNRQVQCPDCKGKGFTQPYTTSYNIIEYSVISAEVSLIYIGEGKATITITFLLSKKHNEEYSHYHHWDPEESPTLFFSYDKAKEFADNCGYIIT